MIARRLLGLLLLAVVVGSSACWSSRRVTHVRGVGDEGALAIVCQPDDAEVYVDGVYQGQAKQFDGSREVLALADGPHEVVIKRTGYKTFRTDVYIAAGTETIHVTLWPLE